MYISGLNLKFFYNFLITGGLFPPDYFDAADSAFKKIKLLQESSLDHHPTSVSCPTPARRRHRTTFTQVRKYFFNFWKILDNIWTIFWPKS